MASSVLILRAEWQKLKTRF